MRGQLFRSVSGLFTRYQVPYGGSFLQIGTRLASTTNVPNFRFGAGKDELVDSLLAAKAASGKTFSQIAKETGLTNLYTAQLFYAQIHVANVDESLCSRHRNIAIEQALNPCHAGCLQICNYVEAQLKPDREAVLRQAVPALTQEQVDALKRCPNRSFHPQIAQEPLVYRFTEAVHHYAESIKAICNEECGDGIMSAIDMYSSVSVITGLHGEKRVVLMLNGKDEKDNTAVLQSTE